MTPTLEAARNRESALDFLRLCGPEGKAADAYAKHVARDFRHHNPSVPAGRDGLLRAMTQASLERPVRSLEPRNVLVDGDRVAVHSRVTRDDGPELAAVHILRFQNGKVVEFWDIVQEAPADAANHDGMF